MAPASSSSEKSRPAGKATVLVVDDSATMRRSVEMSLTFGGYQVVSAPDGAQALKMLQDGLRPDMLITDIVMPGVNGLELIRAARPLLRFTPIVALTTQDLPHIRQAGKEAGVTAWLTKPTGGDELIAIVGRFIRKGPK